MRGNTATAKTTKQPPTVVAKRRACKRHAGDTPCTCAMGNVYRFIEPLVLRILQEKKKSYGYEIAECLPKYALTDSTIDGAALYRTLRTLEHNGYVVSSWEATEGPARRNYSLTKAGHIHLREWGELMQTLGRALISFAQDVAEMEKG